MNYYCEFNCGKDIGVNFTNLLAKSTNFPENSVWSKRCLLVSRSAGSSLNLTSPSQARTRSSLAYQAFDTCRAQTFYKNSAQRCVNLTFFLPKKARSSSTFGLIYLQPKIRLELRTRAQARTTSSFRRKTVSK